MEAAILGEVQLEDKDDKNKRKRGSDAANSSSTQGPSMEEDVTERPTKRFKGWKKARKGIMALLVSAHAGIEHNPDVAQQMHAVIAMVEKEDPQEDTENDGKDEYQQAQAMIMN